MRSRKTPYLGPVRIDSGTRRFDRGRQLRLERLEPRVVLSATPLITEFMASNDATLADGDGNFGDWIEVHNPTAAAVDLAGWHLTDNSGNLDKWTFPALPQTVLGPGDYLVVFASGQEIETYVDPEGNLHTDFRLSASGEYLALTDANETIVHEFSPEYPWQQTDISYGVGVTQQSLLIDVGAAADILVPSSAAELDANWTAVDYLPGAGWTNGLTGVGYDAAGAGRVVATYDASLGGSGVAPDPTTQGWHDDHTGSAPQQQVFDASPDVGLDAWAVIDTGGGGRIEYEHDLSNQDIADGNLYGWSLTSTSRTLAGEFDVLVYRNGVRQYLVWKEINGDGDLEVNLIGDTRYTLTTGGTGDAAYHDHDLTFDPATGLATYWFDGLEIASWNGSAHSGKQIIWGSGSTGGRGEAHYHQVTHTVAGVGDFQAHIDTDLGSAMKGVNASAFVRVPFHVADPAAFDTLTLDIQYDDGFVAHLNGVQVASRNAPVTPDYNSAATDARDDLDAVAFESIDVSAHVGLLQAGNNVLAIQALNVSAGDDDFLLTPRLSALDSGVENLLYFTTPTPGAANGSGFLGFVEEPLVSVERGFFGSPFSVEITTPTANAEIYFTTDGSAPSPSNGALYNAPVSVTTTTTLRAMASRDGFLSSSISTHSYLFLADVLAEDGAGLPLPPFPSTSTWDYEMDPAVVTDIRFSTLEEDLQSLPALSLVMDVEDAWGTTGFYATLQDGRAGERPVSVELIGTDGVGLFQEDAGVRIMGSGSVRRAIGKKSLRLVFRSEFGPKKLEYPFFGPDYADEIDTIAIRGNYFDTWTFQSDSGPLGGACCGRSRSMYLRDQFAHESHAAMGAHAIAGNWVHLYMNGIYWGIYNPTERPDEEFMQSYFGGSDADYDVIKTGVDLVAGDLVGWNEMLTIARGNGPNGSLEGDAAYEDLKQYLDIDQFIDYMLVNFYGGNHDWPHNNWYVTRNRTAGGPFRFYEWDAENFLFSVDSNRTGVNNSDTPGEIYDLLRQNDEFNLRFADRVQRHLFNDGALTATEATARFQAIVAAIRPALNVESARWGDELQEPPHNSYDDFDAVVNEKLTNYFPVRTDIVIDQLRNAGLYSATTHDPPSFNQHGGDIVPGFQLALVNNESAGTLYFTLDGTDPREVGGAVAAGAQTYTGSISLNQSTVVKARLHLSGEWSALTEAAFDVASTAFPGDFNGDGIVDGGDLSNWESGFGTTSGAQTFDGDANADGDVDGLDFLWWQRDHGSAVPATAANASQEVPHPALSSTNDSQPANAAVLDASLTALSVIDRSEEPSRPDSQPSTLAARDQYFESVGVRLMDDAQRSLIIPDGLISRGDQRTRTDRQVLQHAEDQGFERMTSESITPRFQQIRSTIFPHV